MTTKEQAQAAQAKLQGQYQGLSVGLGKDGENWTVEIRDSGGLTIKLPSDVDGVKVRVRSTGDISAQ